MAGRMFAVVKGSLHLVGGVVGVEDHTAQHEHRELRIDDAEAVIAGLVEEEALHSVIVGGREERAQIDDREAAGRPGASRMRLRAPSPGAPAAGRRVDVWSRA